VAFDWIWIKKDEVRKFIIDMNKIDFDIIEVIT